MTHEEITASIIEELMRYRKNMGYSREELAKTIGITPWTIKRLETAKTGNVNTLVALLSFYREKGFDINALLDRGKETKVFFDPVIF